MSTYDKETRSDEKAQTTGLDGVGMDQYNDFSVQLNWTVTTPSAKAFLAGEQHVTTLSFDTKANTGDGDFVILYDLAGQGWGIAADKTGSSPEPTHPEWLLLDEEHKAQVDLSGIGADEEDVAAAFETAFDGLTGFSSVIVSDDSADDGTMTMTHVGRGIPLDPFVGDADGGAKSYGEIEIADPEALMNDVPDSFEVAGVVFTAQADWAAPEDNTFQAFINATTATEAKEFKRRTAQSLAAQINAHATTSPLVFATANGPVVEIEALEDGVAGDSLTLLYNDNDNDGTSVGGTVTGSGTLAGGDDDDSSISQAETNEGVVSAVDVENNTITIPAHGMKTGLKGQLTTTDTDLPSGFSTTTDYFVIVVDANTIKLATSLVNANAGEAVNILDEGTGTHTFTSTSVAGASVKLQESSDGNTWTDISGATDNITTAGSKLMSYASKAGHVRPYLTMTAGQIKLDATWIKKG